jgi:hypothetical protein
MPLILLPSASFLFSSWLTNLSYNSIITLHRKTSIIPLIGLDLSSVLIPVSSLTTALILLPYNCLPVWIFPSDHELPEDWDCTFISNPYHLNNQYSMKGFSFFPMKVF